MNTGFEETRSVVHEAINVFNPALEVESVRAFKKTVHDTNAARHQQQLALKATIKGFLLFFHEKQKKMKRKKGRDILK